MGRCNSQRIYTRICVRGTGRLHHLRPGHTSRTLGIYRRNLGHCPTCGHVGRLGGVHRRVLRPRLVLAVGRDNCPNSSIGVELRCHGIRNFALGLCAAALDRMP